MRTLQVTLTLTGDAEALTQEHLLHTVQTAVNRQIVGVAVAIDETQPPELEHDRYMLAQHGHTVNANGKLERRIVWNLLRHLAAIGWLPLEIDDSDTVTPVADAKAAMEVIFNLDDCWVKFHKGHKREQVRLVLGNGTDCISNWTIGSADFDKLLDTFETEHYE